MLTDLVYLSSVRLNFCPVQEFNSGDDDDENKSDDEDVENSSNIKQS